MDESPWDWLNFRYENDDLARFTLILDGVEEVVGRINSDNVADQRLALIVCDCLGYVAPDSFPGSGYLSLRAGAEAVQRWLEEHVPQAFAITGRGLAADVEARVRWAKAMIDWLGGWQGPGKDEIEPALRWHDFWRQHGDPDFITLERERDEAYERLLDDDHDDRTAARAELEQREAAYSARLAALSSGFRQEVSLGVLPSVTHRGRGLLQARDAGTLLSRYRTLDMELRVFEEPLGEVAVGWDEHVQSEIDRLRGK